MPKPYIAPPATPLPAYDPEDDPPRWKFSYIFKLTQTPLKTKEATPYGSLPESDDKPDWRGVAKSQINPMPVRHEDDYKNRHYTPNHYFWFDTPDYADPFKKLGYMSRWICTWGVGATLLAGTFKGWHAFYDPSVKSYHNLLTKIFLPMSITLFGTGMTVIAVANLRGKKDDLWNYLIGGLVGCAFIGRNNHIALFTSSYTYLPAVLYTKYNSEINGLLDLKINQRGFGSYSVKPTGEHGINSLRLWPKMFYDPGRIND